MMSLDATMRALIESAAETAASRALADIDRRLEQAVERVHERRQAGALLPFEMIKGGTPAAARMWLNRHPEIKKLGVRVGKRLLFQRDAVMAALRAGDR